MADSYYNELYSAFQRIYNSYEQQINSILNSQKLTTSEKIERLKQIDTRLKNITRYMQVGSKNIENLIPKEKNEQTKQRLEDILKVYQAYLPQFQELDRRVEEELKKLEDGGGDGMVDATATQTQSNAQNVIVGLLQGIYDIMGAIVNALKNYAGDIAEILVGGVLAYTVVRYGQRIFRGITRWVGSLV